MKVRAKETGYYEFLREAGTEFEIKDESELGDWMEPIEGSGETQFPQQVYTDVEPEPASGQDRTPTVKPEAPEEDEKPIEKQNVAELRVTAGEMGIEVPEGKSKAEIREMIKAKQEQGE